MRISLRVGLLAATLAASLVPGSAHAYGPGFLLMPEHNTGQCLGVVGLGNVSQPVEQSYCFYTAPHDQTWYLEPHGSGTYRLRSAYWTGGLCLDVSGGNTADGTQLLAYPCNGHTNEDWSLRVETAGGDVTIRSALDSSKCVDVYGSQTYPGAPVILYTCNGGANQRWRPVPVGADLSGLT